jgi:3-deoxy-7-phosphoheptulonate synthase
MILVLRSPQLLPAVIEVSTRLGLSYRVSSSQNGEQFLEINSDGSPLSPAFIGTELGAFGQVLGLQSKTPLLDRLPNDFSVSVSVPGAEPVIFQRWSQNPVWIAGPCSLDNAEMLRKNAAVLQGLGVRVLRGGAIKPRTSPHDYQGVGREGFRWLADIAHEFQMAAVSEALSEDDVEAALEYLDIVQVGARNMQNFALLKKLGLGQKPILLKRAPGATLLEWASAAEYILASGNSRVILCERGVRGLERELRYTLDLAGVAWMQTRFALPIVVDPSHATGTKQILGACAAAALALPAAGIMLETHPHPVEARSDALQALDMAEFAALTAKVSK